MPPAPPGVTGSTTAMPPCGRTTATPGFSSSRRRTTVLPTTRPAYSPTPRTIQRLVVSRATLHAATVSTSEPLDRIVRVWPAPVPLVMTTWSPLSVRPENGVPAAVSVVAVADVVVPVRRPVTIVCSGTSRSPSAALSNIARTRTFCAAVEPAAKTRVAEVCQVTPSSMDSSRARDRPMMSTAGATIVTSTSVVGTLVGRTRIVPYTAGVRSPTTTVPPMVSTESAGASSSRISAAMPSTGMPTRNPRRCSRPSCGPGRCGRAGRRPARPAPARRPRSGRCRGRRRCWSARPGWSRRRRSGRCPPCRRG